MRTCLLTLLVLMSPVGVEGAVVISEVAWMGTTESANDEWIELYNDGAAQSVEGWVLTDGASLAVELAGTVGAGQYAVLERTDDASAPGSAFVIYTGALSNTGTTLTLYDASGSLIDRVAGGEEWEAIGGDNTTKETAQLTTAGWVTAAGTPGSSNVEEASTATATKETPEQAESEESTTAVTTGRSRDSVTTLHIIPRELSLRVTVPTRVYVNQAVTMRAEGRGLSDVILNSLRYSWNFGDSSVGSSASATHRYRYPGNYVVSLHATYGDYEATQRTTITVLPMTLSLTKQKNGDVVVHNDAKYEVDISGYTIAGVTMPERSFLLPGASITLPARTVHDALTMLHDETGKLVAALEDGPTTGILAPAVPQVAGVQSSAVTSATPEDSSRREVVVENVPVTPAAAVRDTSAVSEGREEVTETTPLIETAAASTDAGSGLTASDTTSRSTTDWPAIALIGILLTALLGVYTRYL